MLLVVATHLKHQKQRCLQLQHLHNCLLFTRATTVSHFVAFRVFFLFVYNNYTNQLLLVGITVHASLPQRYSACNNINGNSAGSTSFFPPPRFSVFLIRFTYEGLFIAFFSCFIICCCYDCYYCAVNCIHKQGKPE